MKKIILVITAAAALLALGGCEGCKKKEPPPPQPLEEVLTDAVGTWETGHWCEYRLKSAGGKTSEVTVSLVGMEPRPGGDYFWLEVVVTEGKRKVITKALLPQLERVNFLESGKDLTKESERLIIKVGDEQALELPLREMQLLQEFAEVAGEGADLNEVFGGGKDVKTADAGEATYDTLGGKRLRCRKLTITRNGRDEGYAYAADDVPLFGIAYSENAKGTLDLVDFGFSGATTLITEEPKKLDLGGLASGFGDIKIK